MDQNRNILPLEVPWLKNLRSNSLANLPAELLLSIADVLPPEDIVCLSLGCHRLLEVFKKRIQQQVLSRDIRLTLLRRLEKDHPKYFICYYCCSLHQYELREHKRHSSGLSRQTFRYTCRYSFMHMFDKRSSLLDPMHLIIHHGNVAHRRYVFHFLDLYLAMRYFYYGPEHGLDPERLCSTEVTYHPRQEPNYVESTFLFSVDVKIHSDPPELYMRIQDVVNLEDIRALMPAEILQVQPDPRGIFRICGHVSVAPLIEYMASTCHGMKLTSRFGTFLLAQVDVCHDCNTDFMIQVSKDFHGGATLVITRWINLGAGLTPDDPRWSFHARFVTLESETLSERYMGQSPRHTFEDITDISVHGLRSRNLKLISNQRYRTAMKPIPGAENAWILGDKAVTFSYQCDPTVELSS